MVRIKNKKIEYLVQELQSIELGTLDEIYRVLIPPFSRHNILPNEFVADWCNERLIQQEGSSLWKDTFRGYLELLYMVHWREAQDRFANRAAAILVEFLLRLTEDPKPFRLEDRKHHRRFKNQLRLYIRDQHLLKAILSLKDILARRWGLPKDGRAELILRKVGLKDLLAGTRLRHLPLEGLCHSDDFLREDDFSFPDNTDVFGWTKDYWMVFNGTVKVSDEDPFYDYTTLDIAGQSVLHHIIGAVDRKGGYGTLYLALYNFLRRADDRPSVDSEIFTARCNNQTPLHRAARAGHPFIIDQLSGIDLNANAADNFGRTALCLAAHNGDPEVVNVLCDKMTPISRDRTDSNARNALHYVVLNQNEEAALALIERGIDINMLHHLGRSPVLYAAMNKMERVVDFLLT